jgi:DNA-binding transcriptional regulator YdaS (Cro superfamily)
MSLAAIEKQLLARVSDEQRRWQEIAVLLMRVKHEALWQGHESSFTAWVESLARRADLQGSVFWRCLNAGRIYLELTGKKELDATATVSAEALELADKIRRHAPRAVASELLERTLEGEVTRAELRQVWDTYRVAAGSNARGRLPDDPEARELALTQRTEAWEAQRQKPESRAEVRRSELISIFRSGAFLRSHEQVRAETKLHGVSGRLAAVLVVRRSAESSARLELHGLWTAVSAPELEDYEFKAPTGIDFMWLAVAPELGRAALAAAPRMLGVLELGRGSMMRTVREAQRRPVQAEGRLSLLSTLLQTSYGWPEL